MAKIITSKEEFKNEISKSNTVVDFYADWCGPCKMLAPIFDEVAKEQTEINFIKVNTDDLKEIANEYGIMSIPTLIKFENGEEKQRHSGFIGKDQLIHFAK